MKLLKLNSTLTHMFHFNFQLNTDFQLCHSTNNFKEKWQTMAPMLLEILLANISNQFVKSKLTQYRDLSETARVVALLLGLHVFLYESGKWRPSILESFRFMVLLVKNENTQEQIKIDFY